MNSYAGVEYTNEIRALAYRLQEGTEIPTESLIVTLQEAAEKIDELALVLERCSTHINHLQGVINDTV